LASTDNQDNQKTEHIEMQTNVTQKGAPINSNTLKYHMLRKKTDAAWFSHLLQCHEVEWSVLSTLESAQGSN